MAISRGEKRVIATVTEGGLELLRNVAGCLVASDAELVVLLAAPVEGGTAITADRGAASTFDCGAFLKRAASLAGGRGGGRPDHAEGRVGPAIDWSDVAAKALAGAHASHQ